jgi:hypothetical protein
LSVIVQPEASNSAVAVAAEERRRLVHEALDRLLAAQAGLPDRAAGKDATHRAVPGSLLQPQHLRGRSVDPSSGLGLAALLAQVLRPLHMEATCHRTALNSFPRDHAIRVRP